MGSREDLLKEGETTRICICEKDSGELRQIDDPREGGDYCGRQGRRD